MELLGLLLGLFFLALVLVPPILALVAWNGQKAIRERLERLEHRVDAVGRRVAQLTATPAEAARPAEAAPTTPVAAPVPTPSVPTPPSPEAAAPEPFQPDAPVRAEARPVEATPPTATERPAEPPPPPVAPLPPPIAPEPPPPPPLRIDWESWLGVRGAALLGAIALALAGLLFVKYSIEHGLISPTMRVAIGFVVGAGLLAASEKLRRNYAATANALTGAGVVILYGAVWAARVLYQLIPFSLAFALMVLITVTAGLLAYRHSSQVIAILGLVGGFATPLLLSTGSDHPIGLFGYVLLLDLGLLALARTRRWPGLALFGFAGTLFFEALWIFVRMTAATYAIGLVVLALFALLFALAARFDHESKGRARFQAGAAILLPFAFAIWFAVKADFGQSLWPLAALLALLTAAAATLARGGLEPYLGRAAAAADLGVVFVWTFRFHSTLAASRDLALVAVTLAAVLALFVERDLFLTRRERAPGAGPSQEARLLALGLLILLAIVPIWSPHADFRWLLAGAAGLVLLLLRQTLVPGFETTTFAAAIAIGLAPTFAHAALDGQPGLPGFEPFFGAVVAIGLGFRIHALIRQGEGGRWAEGAAAAHAFLATIGLVLAAHAAPTVAFHAVLFALTILGLLAATRLESGRLELATTAIAALAVTVWIYGAPLPAAGRALVALAILVALLSAWPLLAGPRLAARPWAWRSAAIAGPLFLYAARLEWLTAFGDAAIGLLPLLLAGASLAIFAGARRTLAGAAHRIDAFAWAGAAALGLVSVAIPLQLDREWITVGWAVEALLVALLWKRLRHRGLVAFALGLLAAVTVRLLFNPSLLAYHQRSGVPILNWLAYTYLLPAAAFLGTARVLGRDADDDALRRHGAAAAGFAAIAIVFAWINLTVVDAFSTGLRVAFSFDHQPARDLVLSLAWGAYGLVLLAIGMLRDRVALRWISLAILVLTIGKVFLYDLGQLEDLYRVASLVGLAVSLTLVSLAYHRFAFRKKDAVSE